MKVYVVSDGIYSDYHNVCVVSDLSKAQELADIFEDGSFEGFEVDSATFPVTPPGMKYYCVSMDRHGNSRADQRSPFNYDNTQANEERSAWSSDGERAYFYVWARDKEHATKIANEKRTQMIAMGKWK